MDSYPSGTQRRVLAQRPPHRDHRKLDVPIGLLNDHGVNYLHECVTFVEAGAITVTEEQGDPRPEGLRQPQDLDDYAVPQTPPAVRRRYEYTPDSDEGTTRPVLDLKLAENRASRRHRPAAGVTQDAVPVLRSPAKRVLRGIKRIGLTTPELGPLRLAQPPDV